MDAHEAENNTPKDAPGVVFSDGFLPPQVQGWVLLIVAIVMFVDGIRLLFHR